MKYSLLVLLAILSTSAFGIYSLASFQSVGASPHKDSRHETGRHTSPVVVNPPPVRKGTCTKNPEVAFFMYHYIRDDEPHDNKTTRNLSVTPRNFESHMQTVAELAKSGKITLMKGDELVQAMKTNCFPEKKIWIFTSDDGWVDSSDYLAPIASKYGVPFTFGIISGKIGQKGFVSKEQLQGIADNPLFTIASHSVTHRALDKVSEYDDWREVCDSKPTLEAMTGKKVTTFIYPTGKIGKTSVKHLKECGYELAWSTNFGRNLDWKKLSPYILNRTRISHDTTAEFYKKLAR